MKFRRPGLLSAALIAASVGVFLAGAHLAANALIDTQRAKHMQELSEVALRRAEATVDYGVATLDGLLKRGPVSCDPGALQAVRLVVYQRSAVKDIRAVTHEGAVLCSAYSETLEFDKLWPTRAEMLSANDGTALLFRVEQFFGLALGVLKDVDAESGLVAILGMNAYLFDVMPTELREHSEVLLELSDGKTVADFVPAGQNGRRVNAMTFTMASDRYPLRTVIRVDAAAFAGWDREAYVPTMTLAAVLGLAFGLLLANIAARPKNPIAELDRALAAGEFAPYLQPIFTLRTGEIVGCEILARWLRPDGAVVPPSRFIQLAESSGRIEPITWQIVAAALADLQPLMRADKAFQIYVNIVPRHITAPGFVEEIRNIVADAKVSPRQIVLEITERDELEDLEQAASAIAQLREYGFKVAIDDVGVGHSGLSQVQRLGANILKIDKFFVDSIGRDTAADAVVRMLVELARELKMKVHAEGIETDEQMSALLACGVEEGQGYLVSRPLPVSEFMEFLRKRSERAAPAEDEAVRRSRVA